MNAVTIQVVITGLCTLMNMDNKDTKFLPPAALIIPKADGSNAHGGLQHTAHIPFIAWNTNDVTESGSVTTQKVTASDGTNTSFEFATLEGDEIRIANLPVVANQPSPKIDKANFSQIANHSEYWRYVPSPQTYDSHYVPQGSSRNGLPDDGYVAGYFRFGNGDLQASRPTGQEWIFRDLTSTNDIVRRKFSQEAVYSYTGTAVSGYAVVDITLHDLANLTADRTIKLKAKTANTALLFFIGQGSQGVAEHGIYYLVTRQDPPADEQCGNDHFRAIHMMAHTPSEDMWPLPVPLQPGACNGAHGDSTGYCGPDSKP